jgi:DNA-directed RNA polymerase subunit RPC12/RpoP
LRTYLCGFIPLPGVRFDEKESYWCQTCHREFTPDGVTGYDFREEVETPTWRCFKCDYEVAYESFECPQCGYRLEVGRPG